DCDRRQTDPGAAITRRTRWRIPLHEIDEGGCRSIDVSDAARRALVQNANLVAVMPARIFARRIAATAAHRLYPHRPRHGLNVLNRDVVSGLQRRSRRSEDLRAPAIGYVDVCIARTAGH